MGLFCLDCWHNLVKHNTWSCHTHRRGAHLWWHIEELMGDTGVDLAYVIDAVEEALID